MIQDDVAAAEVTSEQGSATETPVASIPRELLKAPPVTTQIESDGIIGRMNCIPGVTHLTRRSTFDSRDGDVEVMCGDTGFTSLYSHFLPQHFEMSFHAGTPPCTNSRKQTTDHYGS